MCVCVCVCVCVWGHVCVCVCVRACVCVLVCACMHACMRACVKGETMSISWCELSPSCVQMIPAKGHATVQMTFTPPPAEDIAQETDCISYALGYLSLDSDVRAPTSSSSLLSFCCWFWYTAEPSWRTIPKGEHSHPLLAFWLLCHMIAVPNKPPRFCGCKATCLLAYFMWHKAPWKKKKRESIPFVGSYFRTAFSIYFHAPRTSRSNPLFSPFFFLGGGRRCWGRGGEGEYCQLWREYFRSGGPKRTTICCE